MPRLSVIVCSRNPRPDSLRRALQALREQSLPYVEWELLLIDNASNAPLEARYDLTWHPAARHIREGTVGLTPARLRGIAESVGELLVYVDDDNVLAPDYLETVRAIADEHPQLGVFGAGVLAPEFEVAPAAVLMPYLETLALRETAQERWGRDARDRHTVPWGAGLCVSRRVAADYGPLLRQLGVEELIDRRDDRLFANGDVAFSWSAMRCGLAFGVFPRLRLTHLIAADRIAPAYLLRLARDSTFSGCVLDYLWHGTHADDGLGFFERLVRLGLRGVRRGAFAMRHAWAVARATARAREFIARNGLQPINPAVE